MKREPKGVKSSSPAPSQRQLRAGEIVRHAMIEVLREGDLHDEVLENAFVTVTEVRLSPDLKHAVCFVQPLGGARSREAVEALNRHARFLRGKLGRRIDMKFTPELRFLQDASFEEAARMDALFNRPDVKRDIEGGGGA
jgi:ribosome-binding factor A